jgi:hypothetical protein
MYNGIDALDLLFPSVAYEVKLTQESGGTLTRGWKYSYNLYVALVTTPPTYVQ